MRRRSHCGRIAPFAVAWVIGTVLCATFVPSAVSRSTAASQSGEVFRIAAVAGSFDSIDPALAYRPLSWALLDTTCARLMNYPDKAPPAGFRLQPEVAVGYPRVSHDRKTFTFTLRRDFRFSDGTPVRASAFARAIHRTLAPGVPSPGLQYTLDIAGAENVRSGKTGTAEGVIADGNRLVVRLTRPVPDFPARTTMPFFCAVPPTLPSDPEGVKAFPSAGPYAVTDYRPGERVLLRRNRFYRGERPHHVGGFDVDLRASSYDELVTRIERGEADWSDLESGRGRELAGRLARRYRVNKSQFFVRPGLGLRSFALNTSGPLFRGNSRLRRAVGFAVDRAGLRRAFGGLLASHPTDQFLPRGLPGFTDARLYPLAGPDLGKAQALARGHTRSGKAVLYAPSAPIGLATAQVVKQNLEQIGLEVEIKSFPIAALQARLATPGEPWDIAPLIFSADYLDPYTYINLFFDPRFVGTTNVSRFDSPIYTRLIRRAGRLRGAARYRAYGQLDVQLARDAAPQVAVAFITELTFVSKRVGCIVLRPKLDLTAVCLKR